MQVKTPAVRGAPAGVQECERRLDYLHSSREVEAIALHAARLVFAIGDVHERYHLVLRSHCGGEDHPSPKRPDEFSEVHIMPLGHATGGMDEGFDGTESRYGDGDRELVQEHVGRRALFFDRESSVHGASGIEPRGTAVPTKWMDLVFGGIRAAVKTALMPVDVAESPRIGAGDEDRLPCCGKLPRIDFLQDIQFPQAPNACVVLLRKLLRHVHLLSREGERRKLCFVHNKFRLVRGSHFHESGAYRNIMFFFIRVNDFYRSGIYDGDKRAVMVEDSNFAERGFYIHRFGVPLEQYFFERIDAKFHGQRITISRFSLAANSSKVRLLTL